MHDFHCGPITMIAQVITLNEGRWTPDPQKLLKAGWLSAVLADRIGPEDITAVINATNITNRSWKHYRQAGRTLKLEPMIDVITDYSNIGSKYYSNQFIESESNVAFWMPEFSEFSVLMFHSSHCSGLAKFLYEAERELENWIENGFWTDGERRFILGGKLKYTVMPDV